MIVLGGSTDVTTYFQMRLLTGGDATGLTISDFDMQYVRTRETAAAKADAVALAAANTAHTDNRGIEVDATDTPGLYRFDWPDAAFADGTEVILTIKHTSCFTESLRVELVDYNPRDGVRLGLAALPNAAADAAGGLIISDAGGLDADDLKADVTAILVDTAEIGAAGAGLTEAGGTGDHLTAVPWNAAWDAEVQSEVADALAVYDPPTKAELDTAIALVTVKTDNLPSDPADESLIIAATDALATLIGDVPTNAELTTALGTADDAVLAQIALVKAKTDSLTFTVAGFVDANIQAVNDVTVTGAGTTADPWYS